MTAEITEHYTRQAFLANACAHGLDDTRTRDAFTAWAASLLDVELSSPALLDLAWRGPEPLFGAAGVADRNEDR